MPFGLQANAQPPAPPMIPIHVAESAGNGDLETLRVTLPSLGIGEMFGEDITLTGDPISKCAIAGCNGPTT